MTRRLWIEVLGLDDAAREARLSFLDIGPRDLERLARLRRILLPHLDGLVRDWHDELSRLPQTRKLLSSSRGREHLRTVQVRYFQTLLTGPYDRDYFEDRLRIGFVHERVGLDPAWYTGAYRKFLERVRRFLADQGVDDHTAEQWFASLEKAVFLDMQLALDAYFHTRNQAVLEANRELRKLAEELKAKNEALRIQFARAQEAARIKEEFLSKVSHELRTPLNAILGYADLLADGIEGPVTPEQRESLRKIRAHGERLVDMIDQMLDAARMAAAGLAAPRPFDPAAILNDLARAAGESAEGKGLRFRTELPSRIPPVLGDPEGFRLALGHLLENAVKFTDRGEVALAAEVLGDRVRFRVSDTGPGVPEEHRQRIFEPFHQVEAGDTREVTGLGMGLTLARQAVERMGGVLELAHTGPEGSTFHVELPRARKTRGGPRPADD